MESNAALCWRKSRLNFLGYVKSFLGCFVGLSVCVREDGVMLEAGHINPNRPNSDKLEWQTPTRQWVKACYMFDVWSPFVENRCQQATRIVGVFWESIGLPHLFDLVRHCNKTKLFLDWVIKVFETLWQKWKKPFWHRWRRNGLNNYRVEDIIQSHWHIILILLGFDNACCWKRSIIRPEDCRVFEEERWPDNDPEIRVRFRALHSCWRRSGCDVMNATPDPLPDCTLKNHRSTVRKKERRHLVTFQVSSAFSLVSLLIQPDHAKSTSLDNAYVSFFLSLDTFSLEYIVLFVGTLDWPSARKWR